jgi:hypothetical protein
MNQLEQSYYDSMFASRYPMALDPGVPEAIPSTETEVKPAKAPLKSMEGREDPHGSVKEIPRNVTQKAIGNMGAWIQSLAEQLDKFGLKIKLPGTDVELNPTLKDVTVGDMGRVLEDISYGFYPVRGKHMTFGAKPDAAELMNLPIVTQTATLGVKTAGAVAKAGVKAAAGSAAALTATAAGSAQQSEKKLKYDEKGNRVKP